MRRAADNAVRVREVLIGALALGVLSQSACTGGGGGPTVATSHDVRVSLVNPTTADPFSGIDELRLQILQDDQVLFQETFAAGETAEFPDMSHYGRVRFTLAGLFGSSVASFGRSAEVVLIPGEDTDVSMLFLPVNRAYPIDADVQRLRSEHTATLLPTGQVLLAGGANQSRTLAYDDTELFDPLTAEFLPGPLLPAAIFQPRLGWSRDLLLYGVGGKTVQGVQVPSNLTWRYDPADETVEELNPLNEARLGHCFTFFRDDFAVAMGGTETERIIETLRQDKDDDVWKWSDNVMDTLVQSQVTGCVAARDGRVFVQGLEASATGVFDYTSSAAAANPDLGGAFTAVDSSQQIFLDGAMIIPLTDGEVWVGGGLTSAGQPFAEGRNFDLDTRVFVQGVAPDEVRIDGSWDHWIDDDWAVLGCGSPDGDATHSQASVELVNLSTGERLTTIDLDRSRPGCEVTTLADGAVLVSGGYAVADDAQDAPAVVIVPYTD